MLKYKFDIDLCFITIATIRSLIDMYNLDISSRREEELVYRVAELIDHKSSIYMNSSLKYIEEDIIKTLRLNDRYQEVETNARRKPHAVGEYYENDTIAKVVNLVATQRNESLTGTLLYFMKTETYKALMMEDSILMEGSVPFILETLIYEEEGKLELWFRNCTDPY